jgi:hypothetical protein
VSSKPTSDTLDLERDLPTTARDVTMLARLRRPASLREEGRAPVDAQIVAAILSRRPTARAAWIPFTLPDD